jgi:site-specific recombinase XerD
MDDIRQAAMDRFHMYLERRQFSAHTIASYTCDLRLFFLEVAVPLAQVSFRDVDQFVDQQHQHGRAWATINRRLNALKHFFDFCLDQQWVVGNPVKPSHFVRRGRPLPKALSREGYPLKAGQLTYDCRYSTMHGMPVTGGRGFRGLKPLWYNSVPL